MNPSKKTKSTQQQLLETLTQRQAQEFGEPVYGGLDNLIEPVGLDQRVAADYFDVTLKPELSEIQYIRFL